MTTVSPAPEKAIDRQRYPGVRSFQEPDARRFFGRTHAAEELLLRVLSVRLLLQFAPSGAGKTSLLNAGLFPRVRPHGCFPFAVRLNEERESLVQAVERSLRDAARTSTLRDPEIPAGAADVWTLLAGTQLWSADLTLLTPVLVFDQFEEVFTLRDDAFRKDFARQIGELSRGHRGAGETRDAPPDVKIVISLREEYLGALEEMSVAIPDLFRERLRVSPLTPAEARDAIVEPARLNGDFLSPRFTFEAHCVDELIDFIDGVSDRVRVIEPLTLQLVCQRAEAIATDRAKMTPDPELRIADFGGTAGLEQLVHQYYTTELDKLPNQTTRRKAVMLFEQGLLDPTGKRLMLEEGEIGRRYGLSSAVLRSLVDSRLLRREPRNESVFYEISHDRLTEVIARHRTARLPRWAWLALAASAVVIVGLVAVMSLVLFLAYRADEANRKTASALHVLFGDALVARLREAGLSDALAQVLGEAPAMESDPLAQALQLRRQGELALERDTRSAAQEKFEAALAVLDRAKAGGRQDVAIDAERAQVLKDLGDVLSNRADLTGAAARYTEALKTWDEVVGREAKADYRLSAAETRTSLSILADRMGNTADAEAGYMDAARRALPDLESAYVRPPRSQANSAFDVGRAEQVFADAALGLSRVWWIPDDLKGACALATELLRLRPLSAQARTQLGTAGAMYGASIVTDADWRKARVVFEQANRQFRELVQFDPRNRQMTRELAALRLLGAQTLVDCNRVDECRKALKGGEIEAAESTASDSVGIFRQLLSVDPANRSLQDDIVWGLTTQANLMLVQKLYGSAMRAIDEALDLGGTPDPHDADARMTVVDLEVMKAEVLSETGRALQALEHVGRALAATDQLPAESWQRYFRRSEVLYEKASVLTALGRKAEAGQVTQEALALEKATNDLKFARRRRANAADAAGRALVKHADTLSGSEKSDELDRAMAKYEEAISNDLFQPVYWSDRQRVCATIAEELTPADQSANASNHSGDKRIEAALRCSVGSAWMTWVLSDEGTGAADARDIDSLLHLYEARRELAMFLRDHDADPEALALAEQGVREAEQYARPQKESASTLFLLGDANYGLGLMREKLHIDGWEQSIRAALGYGGRLVQVSPTAAHYAWLGEMHVELATLLDNAQRKDAAVAERSLGREACQGGLRLARTDAERKRAQDCLDEAKD